MENQSGLMLPPPFSVPELPPHDPKQLREWLLAQGIHTLFPVVVDARGEPRGPFVSVGNLLSICKEGQTTDGSSIDPYGDINYSDVRIFVDPTSVRRLPGFSRVAIGFCNAMYPNRTNGSFRINPGCFRTRLQRVLATARKQHNVTFRGGYETECFAHPKQVNLESAYVAGINTKGNYQQLPHLAPDFDVVMKMLQCLAQGGLYVTVAHTEVSHRQWEINTEATDLVKAAEDFMVLRMGLPRIADQFGYVVDFSAKPVNGWNGSGEHTHISAVDLGTGNNAIFNRDSTLTKWGSSFVAGLFEHADALTYLGNLWDECYRRIKVVGFEAPVCNGIGWANRTVCWRLTGGTWESYHIEFRAPSPLGTHAYALYIGLVMAGLDGVRRKLKPPKLITKDAYKIRGLPSLPSTRESARRAFAVDKVMKEAFTPEQFKALNALA